MIFYNFVLYLPKYIFLRYKIIYIKKKKNVLKRSKVVVPIYILICTIFVISVKIYSYFFKLRKSFNYDNEDPSLLKIESVTLKYKNLLFLKKKKKRKRNAIDFISAKSI